MTTATFSRDPIVSQLPTDDLLRMHEVLGWDRLECEQSDEPEPTRSNGLAFIDLQLQSIDHELKRREALRRLPGAPAWPSEPSEELRRFWRELKDRVSVLDLYHRHFPQQPLRRAGASWRGRCVLHGGTNPSAFSVFNDGRNWHCHSCGAGGDLFDLAALFYRMTNFRSIADQLADEFNIERPQFSTASRPERQVRVRIGA